MLSKWIAGAGQSYFDAAWNAVTRASSQAVFRRNPCYTNVLEHVSESQGQDYLSLLIDPVIIKILLDSENADEVGGGVTYNYRGRRLSPTTIRYAKVLQDLVDLFPNIKNFRSIAEIGIGYGGQARLVSEYATARACALQTYDLIDMLPVCLLAQSYLDNFRLLPSCRFMTKSEIPRNGNWDFVISNYAFSEFSFDLQKEYLENVILKATSGYLTMNTGLTESGLWNQAFHSVELLMEMLPNAALLPEKPLTSPSNYIIVFGDRKAGSGFKISELRNGPSFGANVAS